MSTCDNPACDKPARCRGYCDTCYRRWRRSGDPALTVTQLAQRYAPDTCEADGCESTDIRARGLCKAHYQRQWREAQLSATVPIVQCGDCGALLGVTTGPPWPLIDRHRCAS